MIYELKVSHLWKVENKIKEKHGDEEMMKGEVFTGRYENWMNLLNY